MRTEEARRFEEGSDIDDMRAKEVDLLQQTLQASQRRCSALGEELQDLKSQLERTGGGGGEAGDNEALKAELAKEKALRERYAALCVKLESACETPPRGGRPGNQEDPEARARLEASVAQAEAKLRETEARASAEIAEKEREISRARQETARGQQAAERLQQAERALEGAKSRAESLLLEKQQTEEAMAVSVGAQEERISELSRQLQSAQAAAAQQRNQPSGGKSQVTDEEVRAHIPPTTSCYPGMVLTGSFGGTAGGDVAACRRWRGGEASLAAGAGHRKPREGGRECRV